MFCSVCPRNTWHCQVVIFCSKVDRAVELDRLLNLCNFPSLVIHSRLKQEER